MDSKQDSIHSVLSSAKGFFSGTMLSRLSGLLRDIVMAFAFGTGPSVAAFLAAFRFAHLLRRLFGESVLSTTFAPVFEKLRHEGTESSSNFMRDFMASMTFILVSIIFLVMAILGGFIVWGNLNKDDYEILWLTFVMMPSVLFICLFGLNAAWLQCEKRYFLPGAAPILFNLTWAIGALILMRFNTSQAMSWMGIFVILGCYFQWMSTLPSMWKTFKQSFRHPPTLFSSDVLSTSRPIFLGMAGIAAGQVNSALDVLFARYADLDGPAYLWYAIRLQQLPLALFGIAITGAILPPLARTFKQKDFEKFRRLLVFALKQTICLMTLFSLGIFLFGDRCVHLVFARGDFGDISTIETTLCLWGYTLGLIPVALVLVISSAFYAAHHHKFPAIVAGCSVVINIILNYLFIFEMNNGASSVAFATSISSWINVTLLFILSNKYLGISPFVELRALLLRLVLAGGFALGITFGIDIVIYGQNSGWEILLAHVVSYDHGFLSQFSRLSIEGLSFVISFYTASWILGIENPVKMSSKHWKPELFA